MQQLPVLLADVQAEVGIASAMAASAAVELLGGTPLQCTYAASTVLMNMLGLVCDPVGGLVEYPCQNRNAAGVSNALIAAEMSLAGIPQFIPLDEMIDAMGRDMEQYDAKRIIAFGGGSAMDCAKVTGACIVKPNKPIHKMKGLLRICKKLPLLIAVLTTAGTGSETTLAAVITDSGAKHKYPINDFSLIPRYAVLDYHVTLGLPKNITTTTGMDALTHAVETYIGRAPQKRRDLWQNSHQIDL